MAKQQKKKGLSRNQIGYIIAGFGVFLLGGLVWAATVGQLQINGSVGRGTAVDLDFITASCLTPSTGHGTAGVTNTGAGGGDLGCGQTIGNLGGSNGANDLLTFGMFLGEPGASETVQFYIKNVGSVDADLAALSVTSQIGFTGSSTDNKITLGGTYTGLNTGQCIAVGDTVGPYTISATWPAAETSATGNAVLSAEMDYTEAAAACTP